MSGKEFTGKVVLITGASSGLGRETAIQFAKQGASLALTGRNEENLKKTEQLCCESPKVLLITAELTNEKETKHVIEKTIQVFGKLNILVNNAGIFLGDNIHEDGLEKFDHLFNINVRAVFNITQLAVPYLKKTKGNIINVSSLGALRAFPNFISCSMSKTALDKFTQCIALDLAEYGVRVNGINPGFIKTEIFDKLDVPKEMVQSWLKENVKEHPLGRIGEPIEIANVILFLASDKASFITGALLPIDGGIQLVACKL